MEDDDELIKCKVDDENKYNVIYQKVFPQIIMKYIEM